MEDSLIGAEKAALRKARKVPAVLLHALSFVLLEVRLKYLGGVLALQVLPWLKLQRPLL